PFEGRAPEEILAAQLAEPPAAIGAVRPDTPAGLGAAIMRCLEKRAEARPRSAEALLDELDGAGAGAAQARPALPVEARRAGPARPRPVQVLAGAGALLV